MSDPVIDQYLPLKGHLKRFVYAYLRSMDEAAWESHTDEDEEQEQADYDLLHNYWFATYGGGEPSLLRLIRKVEVTENWEVAR